MTQQTNMCDGGRVLQFRVLSPNQQKPCFFCFLPPPPSAFYHFSCCIANPSSWLKIPAELFQLNSATCTFVKVCSLYHALCFLRWGIKLRICWSLGSIFLWPPPSLLRPYLITLILHLLSHHHKPFKCNNVLLTQNILNTDAHTLWNHVLKQGPSCIIVLHSEWGR